VVDWQVAKEPGMITSKWVAVCHSRKQSASEILLAVRKDSGQAGMTEKETHSRGIPFDGKLLRRKMT
jgi:protease II